MSETQENTNEFSYNIVDYNTDVCTNISTTYNNISSDNFDNYNESPSNLILNDENSVFITSESEIYSYINNKSHINKDLLTTINNDDKKYIIRDELITESSDSENECLILSSSYDEENLFLSKLIKYDE